jgi:hypothetical protein
VASLVFEVNLSRQLDRMQLRLSTSTGLRGYLGLSPGSTAGEKSILDPRLSVRAAGFRRLECRDRAVGSVPDPENAILAPAITILPLGVAAAEKRNRSRGERTDLGPVLWTRRTLLSPDVANA